MNLFKKLFSKKKKEDHSNREEFESILEAEEQKEINFKGVYSKEVAEERYIEEKIDSEMLSGCLKMIEGYFEGNKIENYNKKVINHPKNLDLTIDEGFGFGLYCKAFHLGEKEAALILATAASEYFISTYDIKLFKDTQPEYPLRGMTLKYNKNDVVLSLYPLEYAVKALNYEGGFMELESKIKSNIGAMARVQAQFEAFLSDDDDELD